jgi:hypothetical protein
MDLTSSTPILLSTGGINTHHKRRTNSYKFPILKPSELIQCLKELGSGGDQNTALTTITKEELEEPQHCKEKLRNIFNFLVRTRFL